MEIYNSMTTVTVQMHHEVQCNVVLWSAPIFSLFLCNWPHFSTASSSLWLFLSIKKLDRLTFSKLLSNSFLVLTGSGIISTINFDRELLILVLKVSLMSISIYFIQKWCFILFFDFSCRNHRFFWLSKALQNLSIYFFT